MSQEVIRSTFPVKGYTKGEVVAYTANGRPLHTYVKKHKRLVSKTLKNLKMDDEVYKLRRNVIELIYEANGLLEANDLPRMPRVDIRITEEGKGDNRFVMGEAQVGQKIVWIPASSAKMSQEELRVVVYHELLHAVYGMRHDDKCLLMGASYRVLKKEKVQLLFLQHVRARL